VVGGGGRQHDQVEVAATHPGAFERPPRRGHREVGGQFAVGGNPALADAGALANPLVGGVEPAGQLIVGDNPLGKVRAAAGNLRAQLHAGCGAGIASLTRARSARIFSRNPFTFISMATPIALAKPKASVEPWLFTAMQ